MRLAELLHELDRRDIRLRAGADGRPIADGPGGALTPTLVAVMRVWRQELAWVAFASRTGLPHRWAECDVCGAPVFTKATDAPCRMTSGCEGRHVNPGPTGPSAAEQPDRPAQLFGREP